VLEAMSEPSIYVTGDTVWHAGVAEVARRFPVVALILVFAGAGRRAGNCDRGRDRGRACLPEGNHRGDPLRGPGTPSRKPRTTLPAQALGIESRLRQLERQANAIARATRMRAPVCRGGTVRARGPRG